MPSITRSAEIAAPPASIFEYLREGEHVGEWLPDLLRSERLTPGPVGLLARHLPVAAIVDRYAQASMVRLARRLESLDAGA